MNGSRILGILLVINALLIIGFIVAAGMGNQDALTLSTELGRNAGVLFNSAKAAGTGLYAGKITGVNLLQIITVTLLVLIGFVHPAFRKYNNGFRQLIGALMILVGWNLPHPWDLLCIIIGPLLFLELRWDSADFILQAAVFLLITAVVLAIAYVPVFFFPALREGIRKIDSIASTVRLWSYAMMLILFLIIAKAKSLDGTKSYTVLSILLFEWSARGSNPWLGWGTPVGITDMASLFGQGFGDTFLNSIAFYGHIGIIGYLIKRELDEVHWLHWDQLSIIIILVITSLVPMLAKLAQPLAAASPIGWLVNALAILDIVPPIIVFTVISLAFVSANKNITMLTWTEQVVAGFGATHHAIQGAWQGQFITLGKLRLSVDLLLTYLIIPFLTSLVFDKLIAMSILYGNMIPK